MLSGDQNWRTDSEPDSTSYIHIDNNYEVKGIVSQDWGNVTIEHFFTIKL